MAQICRHAIVFVLLVVAIPRSSSGRADARPEAWRVVVVARLPQGHRPPRSRTDLRRMQRGRPVDQVLLCCSRRCGLDHDRAVDLQLRKPISNCFRESAVIPPEERRKTKRAKAKKSDGDNDSRSIDLARYVDEWTSPTASTSWRLVEEDDSRRQSRFCALRQVPQPHIMALTRATKTDDGSGTPQESAAMLRSTIVVNVVSLSANAETLSLFFFRNLILKFSGFGSMCCQQELSLSCAPYGTSLDTCTPIASHMLRTCFFSLYLYLHRCVLRHGCDAAGDDPLKH